MTDKVIIKTTEIISSLNGNVALDMNKVQKLVYKAAFMYPHFKEMFVCVFKTLFVM